MRRFTARYRSPTVANHLRRTSQKKHAPGHPGPASKVTARVPPGTCTSHHPVLPRLTRNGSAAAAAHAPVPQDRVSPTPSSCTHTDIAHMRAALNVRSMAPQTQRSYRWTGQGSTWGRLCRSRPVPAYRQEPSITTVRVTHRNGQASTRSSGREQTSGSPSPPLAGSVTVNEEAPRTHINRV